MDNEKKALWVDNATHRRLKDHCVKTGKKISFVVKELVDKELKNVH